MAREKGGFWIGLCAALFYPLTRVVGGYEYRGSERLPREGGVLLVMNHVSHLDPLVDSIFVHRNKRVPRFLAKAGLFELPLLGSVMRNAGSIPVYRGSNDAKRSLSAATEAIANGRLVVIYPEGTITKDPDGWPMRPRTGVARLALDMLESGGVVIPAARWGTREIWNLYEKQFRLLPRKTVVTQVGEPIDLSAYRGVPVGNETLREVTDLIMRDVTRLVAELRGAPAPADFFVPAEKPKTPGTEI